MLCNTNNSTVICLHTVKWLNSSIWPIDWTQTDTTTPGQSGAESNGNQRVLHITQSSKTEALPFDGKYPGHSLGGGCYHSAVSLFNCPSWLGCRGNMEWILLTYGLFKETVNAIMRLYKHKSNGLFSQWWH